MNTTHSLVIGAALALGACAAEKPATSTTIVTAAEVGGTATSQGALTIPREPPIDKVAPTVEWRDRYPHAARVLDEWVTRYPDAAQRVRTWSVEDPQQLEVLVMWAVTSPHESLQSFLGNRSSWRSLTALAHEQPEAMASFLHWVRRARPAAEELALRPGGLAEVAIGKKPAGR